MKTIRIRDIGEVITGHTPPTKKREYYGDTYPLLKPTDMKSDERYSPLTAESVSEKWVALKLKTLIPRHATCVVTIGTIGKICVASKPCFTNQAVNSVIPDRSIFDEMYVYYLLKTIVPHVKHLSSGTASGRENVSKSVFSSIEVSVHGLPTQRKIAGILSAYDDLIENNTRRIAILEEMAQAIYREWFVHFRYPGHENVRMVDSELGKIPEGWEVVSLASLMAIQGGSQPPKSTFVYEPVDKYTRLIQIRDYQSDRHLTFVPTTNKLRLCDERDILIARYGASVARICWGLAGAYNVALAKVIPEKQLYRLFLKSFLLSDFFQQSLIGMSGRAAQNGFNKGDISAILLAQPIDDELLKRFSETCISMESSILNLRKKNELLRTTRDLLLPKLISGKLDVEDLDIDMIEPVEELEKATA